MVTSGDPVQPASGDPVETSEKRSGYILLGIITLCFLAGIIVLIFAVGLDWS